MLKNVKKIKNLEIFVTDGPTDWRTDQQTKVYSRLHATKKKKKKKKKDTIKASYKIHLFKGLLFPKCPFSRSLISAQFSVDVFSLLVVSWAVPAHTCSHRHTLYAITLTHATRDTHKKKTRPDTQLPKSRAGGQGPYLRSLDHLGSSSEVQKYKS